MNNDFSYLRQSGLRLTPVREQLLSLLEEKKTPMTIAELQTALEKKGLQPNKTTLYRQIETLLEHNVLEKVTIMAGVTHYEIAKHHHHHFVCQNCDSIRCVEDEAIEKDIHALAEKLGKKGYKTTEHSFFLSGLCQECH